MKLRFSIGRKIGTGFGVLIFLTVIVFFVTNNTLNKSKQINDLIHDTYNPSVYELEKLSFQLNESQRLINEWVIFQSSEGTENKLALENLQDKSIPFQMEVVKRLSNKWIDEERQLAKSIFGDIDTLILGNSREIRNLLTDFDSYDDPTYQFPANLLLEEVIVGFNQINQDLDELIDKQKENARRVSEDMIVSFEDLQFLVKYLGIALVVGGILIAIYTTHMIVTPVKSLKEVLLKLSLGIFPKNRIKAGNDEIGEMTEAMNKLVDGLNHTKEFANAIGSGNFDFPYEPLSNQDDLGKDLLKMRTDLAENERILEEKVRKRTAEVVKQKEEIEKQSQEINRLYSEVTDSIVYARHIQQAILLPLSSIRKMLPNSFVFYRPKDIVSGDFYWFAKKKNYIYFAAVDCTGHGVPGAFMSIIGYNGLEQALIDCDGPADILNSLNMAVSSTFHESEKEEEKTKDGMDIALCRIDLKKKELVYAGAFNPVMICRNDEILITKADKFPIGSFLEGYNNGFTEHTIELEKDDMIYVFSDGYQDQFGGKKGKKYMIKRLKAFLISISKDPAEEQNQSLETEFETWKGKEEQVDDVLMIGVRV